MFKIQIKLLLTKSPTLTEKIRIFSSVLVLRGICLCGCYYMIKYSIYNDFSAFSKKFNHQPKTLNKINLSHHGIQWDKIIYIFFVIWYSINSFRCERKLNLITKGSSSEKFEKPRCRIIWRFYSIPKLFSYQRSIWTTLGRYGFMPFWYHTWI